MARYSPYQRGMLTSAARTERSAAQTAKHAADTEAHLGNLNNTMAGVAMMNGEMLRIQNQLAAATAARNQLLVEQLQTQKRQLELTQQEASRRSQEETKRDRQAFAMWRQTPDGQAFAEWYPRAKAQVDEIYANETAWQSEVATIKSEWQAANAGPVKFALTDPSERNAEQAKVLFIGAGVCFVAWFISLAAGVVGLLNGVFLIGILAFAGAGIWRKVNSDQQERDRVRQDLVTSGIHELGFDPLSDAAPPWSSTDAVSYARRLEAFYVDAYTSHPPATTLPALESYEFVDPSTLQSARLQQILPQN